MTLIEQILEGARDQMRSGRIEDALGLLATWVSLEQRGIAEKPADKAGVRRMIRELAALSEAGTRFWAGWAQLVAPDVVLYTASVDLSLPPASAPPRVALRG